jgi:murein DD-endopeptidase MepM/ murein hydrolase activator NlpD
MATILLQDAHDEIERQLRGFASGLNQARENAVTTVQQVAQPAVQTVQDVQRELSNFAGGLQQAAPAVQQLPDVAGGAIQQLTQSRDQVQNVLTDYASQLVQAPPIQPITQPQQVAGAPTEGPGTGAVVSLPHTEEPATQTDIAPSGTTDGLAGRWKTQFDFGATYTGAYRTGTPHRGVDLVPSNGKGIGTEVAAFVPGTVTLVQRDNGAGGLMVYVQDAGGLTHAYMHLASANVKAGDQVQRGQPIATMGESGTEGSPHLHYEVRKNAAVGDPLNQLIDPRPYMRGGVAGPADTPAARAVAATATTAGISGGGARAGEVGDRGQQILAGAADIASWLGDQGQKALQAILITEGGLSNARGDAGQSAGPLQFYAGGGQLNNLMRETGMTVQQAMQWVEANPLAAVRWAIGTPDKPGYLGAAIQKGLAQGLSGADLATHAQRTGQVSESPERAGQNYNAMFGAGQALRAGAIGDQQVAGASSAQPGVTYVGDQARPAPKAPLYMSTMMAGQPEEPNIVQRGLTLAQDVAGGAQQAVTGVAGAAQQAVGGVQQQAQQRIEDLQAQLDELRRTLEPYNQPPLAAGAPARRAVEEAAGAVAGAIGPRAPGEYDELNLAPSPGGGKILGVGPEPFPAGSIAEQVQSGKRDVRDLTPGEGLQYTAQLYGAGLPAEVQTYRRLSEAKREAIEQGNPIRDVFFLGGVSSAVADAVADPITWALPWGRVANTAADIAARSGLPLIGGAVGSRVSGEALMNGLQNAALEMAQADATPEDVGIAFLAGAGFGGVMRGVQETPVAREIGRQIMQARGRGWPALQQFLRDESGELDIDTIVGAARAPEAPPRPPDLLVEPRFPGVARVPSAPPEVPPAGVQRLPPTYPAGAPEAGFEALARASREAEPDRLARVDLNQLSNDIMPFEVNPTAPGVIKLNPGGMPQMDDLRALYRANEHKRSFYIDQGDEAANIVGSPNTGEFFTNNSITSMQTGVTRQVAEAIQAAGLVRQVARDGRAEGLPPDQIRQNILDALADPERNVLAGKSIVNKRKALIEGYSTGEAPVSSGAKTSTFAGNYESAEGRFFDPRVTNDIHNWRIMNVSSDSIPSLRKNQRTGEMEWFYDTPAEKNAANNDRAYRGVEAVFNELAREMGIDGYSVQSAMWDGMRAMQLRDPVAYRMWQQGLFRQAIERAQRRGVFQTPTDAVADPGDIQRVMSSAPVQRELAKWAAVLKDPLPPELGIGNTVQRTFRGKALGRGKAAIPAKPSTRAFREAERIEAERAAPLVRGLDRDTVERLGYDPEREIFPWLESSHRVAQVAPDEYVVHLPAGNEDTARYVAAQVGQAADADARIHVPDYRSGDAIGVSARGEPDEVAALQRALDNMGITNIRGTGGRSLQVPLRAAGDQATIDAVQDAAMSVGFPQGGLAEYTGRTADVPRSEYAATNQRLAPTFAPTTAGRSDLLQRGLGAVPEGRGPPAEPPGGGLRRARGEAELPFSLNLGGAALGGYAGYAATPEDADWSERARNVGLGATAGLLGTAAITRGGGRLARAAARRGPPEARQPFRAPGGPELRATTQEPPGGPPAREPTRLGEVQSNPYALREPRAGEESMTTDDMLAYADELDARLAEIQGRRDIVDDMIRNPSQKVQRPPWGAGWTNVQLAEIAKRHGISPYQEAWWDTVGLETGSGEVRYDVGESGIKGRQTAKELSPTELRAERRRLDQEEQDIAAAYEQMTTAGPETRLYRPPSNPAAQMGELPFDTGAPPDQPASPAEAQGGMDEGARLAQEVVLSKGRGTLRSDEGTVSLTGDVRGTALVSSAAVQEATATPPSARTAANMPNLDSMIGDDMPEIAAQIRKAAEDNPDLFEKYRQGVISQDSLKNDLAKRVGMSLQDWLKTPVGKGFNPEEMVALQAAAIEAEGRATDMGMEVIARGGVDALTPEELAFSAATLANATGVLTVARGGRTTAGRTLNALKNRFDRTMARDITASNERLAHQRLQQQARRAAAKATAVLQKGRVLEREANAAKAEATRQGAPRNILAEIDQAYAELDRYNAMTLHEKGVEFDRLKAERAERAAARKARVRGAPEELLSALRAELAAERKIFAGRKNTWETMAFWDSKAAEQAVEKRTAFRGQLYIEQQRKVAQIAAKGAEKDAARAFDDELRGRQKQTERATRVLEAIGGQEVTKDLLRNYIATLSDPSPEATAKFLKGIAKQSSWGRANIVRIAGLVSAPITHAVNVGGNTVIAHVERLAVRPLVVAIDAMRAGITGGERQAYRAELLPALQATGPGAMGALPKVVRALRTGINPYEAENLNLAKVRPGFNAAAIPGVGARTGEVIDAAAEMPLRALVAEDVMFREMALSYHGMRVSMREAIKEGFSGDAAKGRADTILRNLEDYPELAQEVDDAARREVFQERRANIPFMGAGPREATIATLESQVIPFVRTPTNITAQGVAMSPFGFGGAVQAARATRDMPTGTRAERYARGRQVLLAEERLARATIGTGILAAGVWLGAQGRLTADYPEDDQARSALPPGWRPWAFKVDDPITKNTYYVPLQNLGPVGVPLAMAAIATDPVHRGKTIADPDEWGLAAFGVGRYVLDSTYLQGLSDFIDMAQDPRANAAKFAEPLVASYGPYSSLFREMQRTFGVAARNPREGFRGLLDAMLANYPGASGTVPPALTPLGDERVQGATGFGRAVPFRYDIQRDEPTLQVLRKTGVGIPKPPKAIGLSGGSIELTEDERAQLQRMRGQAIRDMVPRVTENSAAVQRAVDLATASATRAFISQLGADEVRKRWNPKQAPEPYYLGTAAS